MNSTRLEHIRIGLNIFAKYGYEVTNCSDDILEVYNLYKGEELSQKDANRVIKLGWEIRGIYWTYQI